MMRRKLEYDTSRPRRTLVSVVVLSSVILIITLSGVVGEGAETKTLYTGKDRSQKTMQVQRIHEDVMSALPEAVQNSTEVSIHVNVTEEDLIFLEEQQYDRSNISYLGNKAGDNPAIIGLVKELPEHVGTKSGDGFFQGGVLELTSREDDGTFGFIWAFSVFSPGAAALRLYIQKLWLPEGLELLATNVKGLAGGQADGPYHKTGPNKESGDFWTRSLAGETVWIVVRAKGLESAELVNKLLDEVNFEVTHVAHVIGQNSGDSWRHRMLRSPLTETRSRELEADMWPCDRNGDCFADPQCYKDTNPIIANAMNAVAKLEWITEGKIMSCTGTLIADTDPNTNNPLMLSAAHCFHGQSFDNLEAFFFHTTDACEGACPGSVLNGNPRPISDVVGMSLLSFDKTLDYALIKLNLGGNSQLPKGVVFLGWDKEPVDNLSGTKLYRLSTPNYGALVYSEHEVDSSRKSRCGIARGLGIHTQYIIGGTAFGSSGSALINEEGKIVGTLMGKCGPDIDNPCSLVGYRAIDSAFANFYQYIEGYLVVQPTEPQYECSQDVDCAQSEDPCTRMQCVSNKCVKTFTTNSCDLGDACTTNDKCQLGECQPGNWICPYPEVCVKDDDCSTGGYIRGISCIIRMCMPSQRCEEVTVEDGAFCDDDDPCTYGDRCKSGECISGDFLCATARYSTRGT